MKIGVYFAYWEKVWDADFFPYIEKVKNLGFDILEVAGGGLADLPDEKCIALRKEAERCGIELTTCIGLPKQYDVSSKDENVRQGGLAYLKRLMDKMVLCGISHLGGITYAYWPADWTEPVDKEGVRKIAIESVRELADYAKPKGIRMSMEVVNRFEHFLLNTAKEAVAFVKDVDRDNVFVMLDTFHMNIEEDSFGDAIREAGSLLGHFHMGEANRKAPGAGRLPWQEMADAFMEIGYDKTAVMEPFVIPGGIVGSDIKVWRDIVDDTSPEKLDEDIRESCAFCNRVFNGKE